MGLRINQNIAAQNAYRNLSVTDGQMAKSLEKLSSGFRINRAADDAAGLSISEGLRSQVGGLKVAVRNAQDGISVVQTAEGAMNEVHSILQRMRDLSVQAASTGSQDETARGAAQTELKQLNEELDRIGKTTKFGAQSLLAGKDAKASFDAVNVTATGHTVVSGTADTFELTGTFGKATLSAADITIAATDYETSGEYQDAIQLAIDTAIVGAGGEKGALKAKVTSGLAADGTTPTWQVELSSSSVGDAGQFTVGVTGAAFGFEATDYSATGNATAQANEATFKFQIGANNTEAEAINVKFNGVSSEILGTDTLDLVTGADAAITAIDSAIQSVSTNRANLGAVQNRLEHTIANPSVAAETLAASESRIRDTDMAQEMVSFTRAQILTQAGTAMLAQANQAPQSVLSLLR
jgi:flagellin